eukprot:jgi/Antlo1/1463/2558
MNVDHIKHRLSSMGVSERKQMELLKNTKISERLGLILRNSASSNRLLLVQAQYTSDKNVTKAIESGLIKNERSLKFAVEQNMEYEDLEKFIKEQIRTDEEIREEAQRTCGSLKDIMKAFSDKFKFNDSRRVMEIVKGVVENKESVNASRASRAKKDWLDEGEIARLHRPGENPQVDENIRDLHLRRTGGVVVTRFPPEPNGVLHIGHAKALNLNFKYAEKHNGYVFLRFDDTNPKNENMKYYRAIIKDVEWLGFKPKFVTASSDYFEKMIEFGKALIREGKAYVCHLPLDDVRKYRRSVGVVHHGRQQYPAAEVLKKYIRSGTKHPECMCPSNCEIHARHSVSPEEEITSELHFKLSPFRDRPVDVNLTLFQEMIDGRWKEGTAVLRLKMDTDSTNPFMLDLVAFRVIEKPHSLTGTRYKVYPSYDFALCICDSLEDVTHSFCSREFLTRQEPYKWLLKNLGLYMPVQWEFSRLNMPDALLSKRKIKKLIENKVIKSIDDPRLFTIKGLRRRGFTPQAINRFCEKVGITFSDSTIDTKMLESFVREDLNAVAKRVMCVTDPIYAIFVCDKCTGNTAALVKDKAMMSSAVNKVGRRIKREMRKLKKKTVLDAANTHVCEDVCVEKFNEIKGHIVGLYRQAMLSIESISRTADGDVKERVVHLLVLCTVLSRIEDYIQEKRSMCPKDAFGTMHGNWDASLCENLFDCECSTDIQSAMKRSQTKLADGVVFDKIICIDGSDFAQCPEKSFMRLSPTQPVGLLGLFPVAVAKEVEGVLLLKKTNEKPKKFIQWVSHPVSVELRMFSPLFDKQGKANADSLRTVKGYCDRRVEGAQRYDKFQFIRMGYFCVDKDSRRQRLVFNLTVNLKNVN